MSKTTKEIYLRAFMLLQKDKKNLELNENWFSEKDIIKAIEDNEICFASYNAIEGFKKALGVKCP